MFRFTLVFILIFVLLSSLPKASRAQNSNVFMVKASGCMHTPTKRSQTGFRLKGTRGIITALHGVIDSKTITITGFDEKIANSEVQIYEVCIERDLVRLSSKLLEKITPSNGFEVAPITELHSGDKLQVIGYPYDTQGENLASPLSVGAPVTKPLKYLAGSKLIENLRTRRSPLATLSVLYVNGFLSPGHSGAPILNSRHQVTGVGNGGLAMGVAGVGWAIPLKGLKWDRPNTAEFRRVSGLSTTGLFTYDTDTNISAKQLAKRNVQLILDKAIKAHGGNAFLSLRSSKITGRISATTMGLNAKNINIDKFTLYLVNPDKLRAEADVSVQGECVECVTVINGKKGFAKSGDEEAQSIPPIITFPLCDPLGFLRGALSHKELLSALDANDQGTGFSSYDDLGNGMNLYFDEETFRLSRITVSSSHPGGEIKSTIRFLNYKEHGGLWLPHRILMNSKGNLYEKSTETPTGTSSFSSDPNVNYVVLYTNFILNPVMDEAKLFSDLK